MYQNKKFKKCSTQNITKTIRASEEESVHELENAASNIRKKKKKVMQPSPCKTGCQNKCNIKFSDPERQEIFDFYWDLPYTQRKDWLLSCIERISVKRRRSQLPEKKSETRKYFINFKKKKIDVCRQFLLKTLDISSQVITHALQQSSLLNTSSKDNRGSVSTANGIFVELKAAICSFIESLPNVPSHYCRSRTNRTYLPSEFHSISNIFRLYKTKQEEIGKDSVSEISFRRIFKTFNIGIHVPKKDKCSFCESHKIGGEKQIDEESYLRHLQQKEHSKKLFLEDQERAKATSSFICASFDLQKVLNVPHTQSMLFYYSRKYSFYNETIYESGTQTAYNFLWGEIDGMRGANEICSILNKYLNTVDERNTIKSVSLYCDSCPGQNKNRQMISMIYLFLKCQARNINEVKLTFLVPGHTYMPVDSVHANIERFVKKRNIWTPSEWTTMIMNSRVNPKPYEVVPLAYNDFYNWKTESTVLFPTQTIKNKLGNKFKLSEANIFLFSKSCHDIDYYQFESVDSEIVLQTLEVRRTRNQLKYLEEFKNPELLYTTKLPLSVPKKNDLQNLLNKQLIPQRYIEEYNEILNTNGGKEDELPETDVEDTNINVSDNENY